MNNKTVSTGLSQMQAKRRCKIKKVYTIRCKLFLKQCNNEIQKNHLLFQRKGIKDIAGVRK